MFSHYLKKQIQIEALSLLSIKKDESVLDIGCGQGDALISLAKEVSGSGRAYGLDSSHIMLKKSKKRLQSKGLLHQVILEKGNLLFPPFLSESFDSIFMGFTLDLLDESKVPEALKKCKELLKVEGEIVVVRLSKRKSILPKRLLYQRRHRHFPNFFENTPLNLGEHLSRAGFSIVHSEFRLMMGLPVEIAHGKRNIE